MLPCRKDFEPVRHVRFGSLADIKAWIRDVRFTPKSRLVHLRYRCPLSARSGHSGSAFELPQSEPIEVMLPLSAFDRRSIRPAAQRPQGPELVRIGRFL